MQPLDLSQLHVIGMISWAPATFSFAVVYVAREREADQPPLIVG